MAEDGSTPLMQFDRSWLNEPSGVRGRPNWFDAADAIKWGTDCAMLIATQGTGEEVMNCS